MNIEKLNLERLERLEKFNEAEVGLDAQPLTEQKPLVQSLAQLLRILGGLMLFVSAGVYLFQGWSGFSGVEKSLKFLIFSVILSAVGFLLGLKVKEDKGARTLLGTSASFLPVHFAQLGAIIYASFTGKAESFSRALSFLEFAPVQTQSSLILVSIMVMGVMLGVVYLAMSVMARSKAIIMTGTYFASSLLLIIPIRDASIVGVIGFVAFCALAFIDNKYFTKDSALCTFEGYIARSFPFISLAVLLGRNYLLYPTTSLFEAVLCLFLAIALATLPHRFLDNVENLFKELGRWVQALAIFPLFAFSVEIANSTSAVIPFEPQVSGTMFALGCFLLARISLGTGNNYRTLGVLSLVFLGIVGMLESSFIFIPLLFSLLASTFAIVYGYEKVSFLSFLAGIIGIATTLIVQIDLAILLQSVNGWMVFGGFGLLVVIFSSLIEKGDGKLLTIYRRIKSRFFQQTPLFADFEGA